MLLPLLLLLLLLFCSFLFSHPFSFSLSLFVFVCGSARPPFVCFPSARRFLHPLSLLPPSLSLHFLDFEASRRFELPQLSLSLSLPFPPIFFLFVSIFTAVKMEEEESPESRRAKREKGRKEGERSSLRFQSSLF